MGVYTFEDENPSAVAPAKLFKAVAKDIDTIVPKVLGINQTVEIVEGNGGPGTIKKITVVHEGETKFVVHKIDALDEANLIYNYSILEGGDLPEIVEKVSFETKVLPGVDGGSIGKVTAKYYTKGDAVLPDGAHEQSKAKGYGLIKAVEGYILANPDY